MILDFIHKILRIGDYLEDKTFGSIRSSQWPTVRNNYLKEFPECAICLEKNSNEVHHVSPFHSNPALELDKENLITLCREHHFLFGHFNSWSSWNENVKKDAIVWRYKINNRPK